MGGAFSEVPPSHPLETTLPDGDLRGGNAHTLGLFSAAAGIWSYQRPDGLEHWVWRITTIETRAVIISERNRVFEHLIATMPAPSVETVQSVPMQDQTPTNIQHFAKHRIFGQNREALSQGQGYRDEALI